MGCFVVAFRNDVALVALLLKENSISFEIRKQQKRHVTLFVWPATDATDATKATNFSFSPTQCNSATQKMN